MTTPPAREELTLVADVESSSPVLRYTLNEAEATNPFEAAHYDQLFDHKSQGMRKKKLTTLKSCRLSPAEATISSTI